MIRGYSCILSLLVLLLTACSEERIALAGSEAGSPVSVTIEARFPEIFSVGNLPGSRGFTDNPDTDYLGRLNVHLLVFDDSGTLIQYVRPSGITVMETDVDAGTVRFSVSDVMSGKNLILHIIATGIDDLSDPEKIRGAGNILAGVGEAAAIAGLTVMDGVDAYWARVEQPVLDGNSEIKVKLLRNFTKIVVEYTGPEDDFVPTGYSVVNRPAVGTIAPFCAGKSEFADFFDADLDALSYKALTASGYKGAVPADMDDHLVCSTAEEIERELGENNVGEPVYFYERPQSGYFNGEVSNALTYIILKGRYRGSSEESYYRIDIGDREDGVFNYLDLLRNFQYTVNISEVCGSGMSTLSGAMEGPASNNLSASVATGDLFSVSYAGHTIEVSGTTVVLTSDDDYGLRFRYTVPSGQTFDPACLMIACTSDGSLRTDLSGTSVDIDVLNGDVIKGAKLSDPDADGWYTLTVTPADAPAVGYLSQNLRIFYDAPGGLSRTVRMLRRQPWKPDGLTHSGDAYTSGVTVPEEAAVTGGGRRDNVNIFFHLPSGLAQSIFPLEFIFESDKQNIYAYPGSSLSVRPIIGSGFDGGTANAVIAFSRIVEWDEYSGHESDGLWVVNPFLYSSTGLEDMSYPTVSIDAGDNPDREPNDNTSFHAVRISNPQGYFSPVVDNIGREIIYDPCELSWTATSVISSEMPSNAAIISTYSSAPFTLYYELPSGLPTTAFGSDGMEIRIHSGIAMSLTDNLPYNLTGSDTDFTQTVSYQEYILNDGVFAAPFTLGSGSTGFNIEVASDMIPAASSTVLRSKYNLVNLRFDGTEYSTSISMPSSSNNKTTLYDKTANTVFTVYYQMQQGIPREYFGKNGLKFTITCSQSYLNYDLSGNTPFDLEIEDAKTATQILTYEKYSLNTLIVAPFTLSAGKNTFSITVSSDITNDKSQSITRRQ